MEVTDFFAIFAGENMTDNNRDFLLPNRDFPLQEREKMSIFAIDKRTIH